MADLPDMRFLTPTVCEIFGLRRPKPCEVGPLEEVVQTIGQPRSMMVVVFDGFGTAALGTLGESCPNFRSICDLHYREIHAVPPPKTPVNFATMATGAAQNIHRIDKKTDPLEVETIFDVFTESGLTTCVAGRQSGSPANLFLRFAKYAVIASSNEDAEVLALVLKAIRDLKPRFILLQFLDIDNAGHKAGPFGTRARKAVFDTDRKLGSIMKAMSDLEGAVMVLADHGQHEVLAEEEGVWVKKGKHDGTRPEDFSTPLAWCNSRELASLSRGVTEVWSDVT